ncbi:hypothetical protein CTI12_AA416920 [Artemisia annua]|uniref:Uncharacterized protein n=1 Tax=Artemisia annua TaxID=35608 RepID=A0A2U1M532_ARTAN|nr:hypothetical protein CTI12_AA416920 [Artemisia annua]
MRNPMINKEKKNYIFTRLYEDEFEPWNEFYQSEKKRTNFICIMRLQNRSVVTNNELNQTQNSWLYEDEFEPWNEFYQTQGFEHARRPKRKVLSMLDVPRLKQANKVCFNQRNLPVAERLKQDLVKYWMMAYTSIPQFVIGRSAPDSALGAFCLFNMLILGEAILRTRLMPWSTRFCNGNSDYMWSTTLLLINKKVAVLCYYLQQEIIKIAKKEPAKWIEIICTLALLDGMRHIEPRGENMGWFRVFEDTSISSLSSNSDVGQPQFPPPLQRLYCSVSSWCKMGNDQRSQTKPGSKLEIGYIIVTCASKLAEVNGNQKLGFNGASMTLTILRVPHLMTLIQKAITTWTGLSEMPTNLRVLSLNCEAQMVGALAGTVDIYNCVELDEPGSSNWSSKTSVKFEIEEFDARRLELNSICSALLRANMFLFGYNLMNLEFTDSIIKLTDNASLFMKIGMHSFLSYAFNRSVVNKYESNLAQDVGSLCKMMAASISQKNEQIQCIEKFCQTFININDKVPLDLYQHIHVIIFCIKDYFPM